RPAATPSPRATRRTRRAIRTIASWPIASAAVTRAAATATSVWTPVAHGMKVHGLASEARGWTRQPCWLEELPMFALRGPTDVNAYCKDPERADFLQPTCRLGPPRGHARRPARKATGRSSRGT